MSKQTLTLTPEDYKELNKEINRQFEAECGDKLEEVGDTYNTFVEIMKGDLLVHFDITIRLTLAHYEPDTYDVPGGWETDYETEIDGVECYDEDDEPVEVIYDADKIY